MDMCNVYIYVHHVHMHVCILSYYWIHLDRPVFYSDRFWEICNQVKGLNAQGVFGVWKGWPCLGTCSGAFIQQSSLKNTYHLGTNQTELATKSSRLF